MRCPKCGYTSFPYLESCRKCGQGLAEQRAALGLYALRSDPPDLLLAYAAIQMDATEMTLTPTLPSTGIDLDRRDESDLIEFVEAEDASSVAGMGEEQAGAAIDLPLTNHLESAPEIGPLGMESDAAQMPPQEGGIPPMFDVGELGDITLELETDPALDVPSLESPQTPTASADVRQVYDLDLDEDLNRLALGSEVDESQTDEHEEETPEYTLEIEDEIDLEIEELDPEVDDDDASEDEDDNDR